MNYIFDYVMIPLQIIIVFFTLYYFIIAFFCFWQKKEEKIKELYVNSVWVFHDLLRFFFSLCLCVFVRESSSPRPSERYSGIAE